MNRRVPLPGSLKWLAPSVVGGVLLLAVALTAIQLDDRWTVEGKGEPRRRAGKKTTALDRYIAKEDPNYAWRVENTIRREGFTVYVLHLTSQQWRTAKEVSKPIWEHWLTVVEPDEVRTENGFLFISGGSISSKAPGVPVSIFTEMATRTGSVVAELRTIPNEPLTFSDETKSRNEDAIISYSWEKFMRTGDETWPLRLPMTKAAVRAMDTITAFSASREGGKRPVKVEKFIVSGGSKRGWTTWTTAAVDQRVIAIAPFVIDCLNLPASMTHHYRAYGFWAPAVGDYLNIWPWTGTPQYQALMQIEDPYQYRDRLTMPKLIVNSTGDQFFLPDSWQFYYHDLQGEKHLRYVPNTKHDLNFSDAPQTLDAFYDAVLRGAPRPQYRWSMEADGSIRLETKTKPTEVRLWQATNPKARDFRLDIIGRAFTSEVVTAEREGVYVGRVAKPPAGWTAYFLEMTYPMGGKYPLKLTTGVRVIPEILPFDGPPRETPPAASGQSK